MALYRYKALNARGEVLDGQMEAGSDAEVAEPDLQLVAQRTVASRRAVGDCSARGREYLGHAHRE